MKPFYFLEYIMLEKIVKFFLGRSTLIADIFVTTGNSRLFQDMALTIKVQRLESIEQLWNLGKIITETISYNETSPRSGWLTSTMDHLEFTCKIFQDQGCSVHLKIVRFSHSEP